MLVAIAEVGSTDVYDLYSGVFGVCSYGGLVAPTARRRSKRAPRRPIRAGSLADRVGATSNPCTTDQDLHDYLNGAAVQAALHVKATAWDVCSDILYFSTMEDERTVICECGWANGG